MMKIGSRAHLPKWEINSSSSLKRHNPLQ